MSALLDEEDYPVSEAQRGKPLFIQLAAQVDKTHKTTFKAPYHLPKTSDIRSSAWDHLKTRLNDEH
jgi:hypothetical protein